MPLIEPGKGRSPKATVSVRLAPDLIAKLRDYCVFIGSERTYVTEQALAQVLDRDPDFLARLERRKPVPGIEDPLQ